MKLRLPIPPKPAGKYERVVIRHGIGVVSGQVPMKKGVLVYQGRVGDELSLAAAKQAARLAARNVLSQIERATNSWETFGGLLRVEGYVASARGFANQPEILDAASCVFQDTLGDLGRHARAAFSVEQLPLNASVELVTSFVTKPEANVT